MKNFNVLEFAILGLAAGLILVSEYYYIVQENVGKAIFIGLWPPTMLILLMYLNSKTKK